MRIHHPFTADPLPFLGLTVVVLLGTYFTTIGLFKGHRSQDHAQELDESSETAPPSPPSSTHANPVHRRKPPLYILTSRIRELAFAITVLRLWWQGEYTAVSSIMMTANLLVGLGDAFAEMWYGHGNGVNVRALLRAAFFLAVAWGQWGRISKPQSTCAVGWESLPTTDLDIPKGYNVQICVKN